MKEFQKEQNVEWCAAQEMELSVELIPAAKKMLQFLAAVDRNRDLYSGPALDRAIYRYQNCWLPLLAKNAEFDVLEGPLIVPLDCEWVWHCHRLNPMRYKTDCEQRFGRILDNFNVLSTVQVTNCPKQTEEIWRMMFPDEPFELDLKNSHTLQSDEVDNAYSENNADDYDLVSAVKRQSTFFYQVSRPFISNDTFLKEAVARYKGFLHLIKKNKENSANKFCVPTYDIDLIWHTHQVHPALYCKDTTAICGDILEHDDDVDSERSEGTVLDVAFMETTKQWEEVFGLRYWRAGAMFRGYAPNVPVTVEANLPKEVIGNVSDEVGNNIVQLPKKMLIEVLLEIVDIKGVLKEHSNGLFVLFRSQDRDVNHNIKRKLSISSENGKMRVANFQCEPTEDLSFELILSNSNTVIGSTNISMENFVNPREGFFTDAWLELSPSPEITKTNPISMRISVSYTPPFRGPYTVNLVHSQGINGSHTSVQDEGCNDVIGLYTRQEGSEEKTVFGVLGKGEKRVLAKNGGKGWFLMDSSWDLCTRNELSNQGNVYELDMGQRKVIMIPGMKLDYELKYKIPEDEQNFITAVEFTTQHPYGNALALFDLKSGFLEIKEEWFLTPGIISAFILRDTLINNGALRPTELTMSSKKQTLIGYISQTYITKSGSCSGGGGCGGKCGGGRCGSSCRNRANCKARCGGSCRTIGADCGARCGGTCKTRPPGQSDFGNIGADCRARCSGSCKPLPVGQTAGNVSASCTARCSGTCKTAHP